MGIASDLVWIIMAALIGGVIAHLLKQPLIFGYMLAGVVVGPYTGGITVQNIHDIEMLAEIGVALLLFTLGLDFSFGELRRMWRLALLVTPLQVLTCAFLGYLLCTFLGLGARDALWVGAAISLSSTMIVLKTLTARDALQSHGGRTMLAILIAQDVALIPIILFLPQLSAENISLSPMLLAAGKSFAFLTIMYLAGVYLFPQLFKLIVRQRSRELFFLAILTVAFGAGFLAHHFGLSFALGAFIAGMLLSETDFNHQALSDVSTLRDLFALIFFVSVGMLFNPTFFASNIVTIVALTLTVVWSKSILTYLILRIFGYAKTLAWVVGIGLSQVGEFAFVLAKIGGESNNLSQNSLSLVISITVLSMILTPGLFIISEKIASLYRDVSGSHAAEDPTQRLPLQDHVIVVGGGVVGRYVARVLKTFEISCIVIESDHKVATQVRDRGAHVVFGDASKPTILSAASIGLARLVVITTTNDKILPSIVSEIKLVRKDIPIVVRVEDIEDIDPLSILSVYEVVQPQLEVGLEMVRQSLLSLGMQDVKVAAALSQLRSERYEPGISEKVLNKQLGKI